MRFHPILVIGLCLNAFNLICRHLGVYQRLPVSEKVQDFLAGFLTGAAIAFLFLGLILTLRPEWAEKFKDFKNSLFGGN